MKKRKTLTDGKQATRKFSQKAELIVELARFLAEEQSVKSIMLEAERMRSSFDGRPKILSEHWVKLRNIAGVKGYPTIKETIVLLSDLLG